MSRFRTPTVLAALLIWLGGCSTSAPVTRQELQAAAITPIDAIEFHRDASIAYGFVENNLIVTTTRTSRFERGAYARNPRAVLVFRNDNGRMRLFHEIPFEEIEGVALYEFMKATQLQLSTKRFGWVLVNLMESPGWGDQEAMRAEFEALKRKGVAELESPGHVVARQETTFVPIFIP